MAQTATAIIGEEAQALGIRAKNAGVPFTFGVFTPDEGESYGAYGEPVACLTATCRSLGRILATIGYTEKDLQTIYEGIRGAAEEFAVEVRG